MEGRGSALFARDLSEGDKTRRGVTAIEKCRAGKAGLVNRHRSVSARDDSPAARFDPEKGLLPYQLNYIPTTSWSVKVSFPRSSTISYSQCGAGHDPSSQAVA